jgi:peptidoglycan hydrolase CwlO-like protein
MIKKLVIIVLVVLALTGVSTTILFAQENSIEKKNDLEKQIKEYEEKISNLRNEKNTLSSQIEYMDTQIYLTKLKTQETSQKIETTEYEIGTLDNWIGDLNVSLDQLSKTMLERIVAGYKTRQASVIDIIFDSTSTSDLVNKLKYFEVARDTNRKVLMEVQEAKLNYEEQKKLREKKKEELANLEKDLENQQTLLTSQQEAKRTLLTQTQNDEVNYQNLLAKLKSEYAAIQGIVSGAGTETELGEVTKGSSIASVIPGASCNSSGGHLHFIVQENGGVTDPFRFLKSVDSNNCSGSSCGSGDGDSFSPAGNWDWPLAPQIKMNQGYGTTWAVRNTYVGNIYNSHNGIDITGSSSNVLAVADGTLYRGSYAGSGGCALPYVKLTHKDSNITTLYLHVYSQ